MNTGLIPRIRASSIRRRDLILLQFSIRHFVGPGAYDFLRESDDVHTQSHAAAQALAGLNKTLRRSERRQAAGEILHRFIAEIRVCVIGDSVRSIVPCCNPSKIFFACLALHFAIYVDVFLIRPYCPPVLHRLVP